MRGAVGVLMVLLAAGCVGTARTEQAFTINSGDQSTATTSVTLNIANDLAVASACVSNTGAAPWTVFDRPPIDPQVATWHVPWSLDDATGPRVVTMAFVNAVGATMTATAQSIYFAVFPSIATATRVSGGYPSDTFDEYQGQNKFGADPGDMVRPATGSRLLFTGE